MYSLNQYSGSFLRSLVLGGWLIGALGASATAPADLPLYEADRISGSTPVIDGKLDDAVWKNASRGTIARQHHDEEPVNDNSRHVGYWMAAWDSDNLYIAADIVDHHVNGRQSNAYEPHNDVLELFFDPLINFQFNLQYRVWPFGKEGGTVGEVSQDPTWGRWEVASTQTEQGYRTEIRVPLAHFMEVVQVDLQPGDLIGFDVSVHDAPFPTGEQWLPPQVTGWSGDGTNWQYASQNGLLSFGDASAEKIASVRPHMEDIGETPDHEATSLWPRISLIEGFFNLDIVRQSWSWERYEPWRLGRVGHALVDQRDAGDIRMVNRTVGPHAHGEALESRPRVIELTLSGRRDGELEELTVLTTPFHPATSYRMSSDTITLFDEMVRVGQPTGPSYVALPLQSGVEVRTVEPGAGLYDAARDGDLAEGWVLVWFARENDPRATDFPVVVYPNRSPKRIEVTAESGLTWTFEGEPRNALTLLPLYGIKAVEKATTQEWIETLPNDVVERVRTWQGRSLRLPLTVREFWQYLPAQHTFELRHQFAYSENLSHWDVEEELIAPLPMLLSSFEAPSRFPETELVDFDYNVYQGGYYGVVNQPDITVKIPAVDLSKLPPRLDRELLSQSELGRKYLKQLDELNLASIFDANIDRVMGRSHFMPHIWPMVDKPDLFSGYPLIEEETRQELINRVERGYDEIIFSEEWLERLWPVVTPYLGSDFRYGNLTYPYGVAEPYYGVVEMLSKMYYFSEANQDYSAMLRHWDRIKELTEIIWYGGFTQYRYDGGTMLGEALVGLIKGAELAGDLKFQRRAMLRLAHHAASAPGYLEGGQRLARDKSWAIRGNSPVLLGDIQQTTPTTASAIGDGSLSGSDGSLYWDRGYGNPVVLRDYALPQVQAIEDKIDREIPEWYKETDHNFKRRDGMFRRYTVRALVQRDPIPELEKQLLGLRETFREHREFDAAVLIIFLQRIQEDLVAAGK